MTTFAVINKTTGVEVYRYQVDSSIEFGGCEFATHDHVVVPDEVPLPEPYVPHEWEPSVFLRRFKPTERMAIRAARATDPVLDDFFGLLDRVPSVHSNDQDTQLGMSYLVLKGYITAARKAEILGAD